jgi:lipopolysaccharide/colanic/teichoic acid biosynthesis glycosyltransferase
VLAYLNQMETLAGSKDSMQLPEPENIEHFPIFTLSNYRKQILEETDASAYDFMCRHIDAERNRTLVLSTTTKFNVDAVPDDVANVVVNLKIINDIKRINKFFESINSKLPVGGLFIDCVVTNEIKKERIMRIYPWGINKIFYFFYFIFKRVFPKMPLIKKFYFFLTNGYDRAISKAEAFGRLYSCGFEVISDQMHNDILYFVARKIAVPAFDMNPTYGLVISLKRMGKNGKTIHVYKFRTMHPYSEYIQEYVFTKNNLQEGGKFKNDFRISTAGRIMRKLWIDELPMIINLVLGDLKLVGVRPLSFHYYNLYSEELKEKRSRHRPGLIPPFYADMPETLDEIMESEMRYLDAHEKHPVLTDIKYFWKAMFNIVIKRKRSG